MQYNAFISSRATYRHGLDQAPRGVCILALGVRIHWELIGDLLSGLCMLLSNPRLWTGASTGLFLGMVKHRRMPVNERTGLHMSASPLRQYGQYWASRAQLALDLSLSLFGDCFLFTLLPPLSHQRKRRLGKSETSYPSCHGIGAFSYRAWLGCSSRGPLPRCPRVSLSRQHACRALVCRLIVFLLIMRQEGEEMAIWMGLISWSLRHGSGVF
jgi:hypothetical protein